MTKGEAIAELISVQSHGDVEMAHIRADQILSELLESMGCADVVEQYDLIRKWYA